MIHRLRRVNIELDRLPSSQLPIEDLVDRATDVEHFIEELRPPDLREIASMLLQGATVHEIASRTRVHRATISRKLRTIRAVCEHMGLSC
jgi:uncharacterized protein YerC